MNIFEVMLLKFKALILIVVSSSCLFSQNGPGGVGTSATNVLWLDANRGVTLSGSSVTNWADQSGNAFNAVPSAVAARPTYVTSSANGYPTIDFDGTNDELWVNDAAALDLTAWHFFAVPLIDNQKNYNAILVKGNDSFENYEMIGFSDASLHMPIYWTDATRTFPNTTTSQLTATANVFEYSYSSAVGRDVYRNNTNIQTDNESKTPSTNNFSLYIGNERNTTGRFLDGDLAEVIMYNTPLNSAQRIIVNNYLAAKYNCTLTASDLYDEDNAANGNYDHDVAGIGRVNGSNIHNDSRGSGIVRILNPTGLGDNEFYFWGHDNAALGTFGTSDYPSTQGVERRWVRVWRGSETGSITNFEIRFDLTGLGPVTASELRLLIDTDNDGLFADETTAGGGVVSGAVSLGSNVYGFTNVTGLNNNIRFTLGTSNFTSTPLPIELIDFTAVAIDGKVNMNWTTASEKGNDYFTIERSKNGMDFQPLFLVKGAGNSQSAIDYMERDYEPFDGVSYYRLKQTDYDGSVSYSPIVVVQMKKAGTKLVLFPNPTQGDFTVKLDSGTLPKETLLVIRNANGQEFYSQAILNGEEILIKESDLPNKLTPGIYFVVASSDKEMYSQKLIVK